MENWCFNLVCEAELGTRYHGKSPWYLYLRAHFSWDTRFGHDPGPRAASGVDSPISSKPGAKSGLYVINLVNGWTRGDAEGKPGGGIGTMLGGYGFHLLIRGRLMS